MGNNILTAFREMARFASIYCFSKCIKTLLCGLCLIPVMLLIHRALWRKSAVLSCYLWLLLVPMAFMGMSRLFYQRYFAAVTIVLSEYVRGWCGYVYFGVMLALTANFIIRHVRLRRRLEKLPQINDTRVGKVKLYLSEANESPFSGGIAKPYIVVPRGVWEKLDKKSRDIILCHELTHIKSGHIIILTVFKFLTFLWWLNPLIYLCESLLKEDIELACDACTVAGTGITRHAYGCVLLGMVEHFGQNADMATASFMDRNDFRVLKKRITYLSGKRADSVGLTRQRHVGAVLVSGLILTAFMLIMKTSYPRYTIIDEIYVYGEDMELIACDTPAVRDAFAVEDRALRIDEKGFDKFLEEEKVSGDYVYVSYGTVMKLPGMGGCGDVVMVNVEDAADMLYLSADTIENVMLELFLKYVI